MYGSLLVGIFSPLKLSDCGIHAVLGDLPWPFMREGNSGRDTLFLFAALLLVLFTLVPVAYLIVTFIVHCGRPDPDKKNLFALYAYRLRLSFQSLNGWVLFRTVALLVLASVPVIAEQLREGFRDAQANGLACDVAFGINFIGVNRFYRDRLMETFLPDWAAVGANPWQPAFDADATRLHEVCESSTCGPYHLVKRWTTSRSCPGASPENPPPEGGQLHLTAAD